MAKENLFEMGANFDDGWTANNKKNTSKKSTAEIQSPEKHQLHFAKEKRRGKVVTIVKPFYLDKASLQTLLKTLKKKMGTGGTIKDDSLEFQGDISTQVYKQLEGLGYGFKK